ncbi:hypothetical protein PMAYCL1PPCAC_04896, partial [Pristionchus mayeri]
DSFIRDASTNNTLGSTSPKCCIFMPRWVLTGVQWNLHTFYAVNACSPAASTSVLIRSQEV